MPNVEPKLKSKRSDAAQPKRQLARSRKKLSRSVNKLRKRSDRKTKLRGKK